MSFSKKQFLLGVFAFYTFFLFLNIIAATENYTVDIYFTVPNTIYQTNERIEIKGYIFLANYSSNGSLISDSLGFSTGLVNLTIMNTNGTFHSNYTFTTDSNGTFYSKSTYYPSATEINASSISSYYNLRAEYKDPNNKIWFSDVEIHVVNDTIDLLYVSPEKATYNADDTVEVTIEAVRLIGDSILYISNVSANGTLRNSTKDTLSSFSCTTASNGKCKVNVTAPSDYGTYYLELNNFKTFSTFSVVPFEVDVYMKDELGQSLKNIFASGEKARVEVIILNASATDEYYFSGYIKDTSGNILKTINGTQLNDNNTFTNSFQFTIDSVTYSNGAYLAFVNISKTGGGKINATTSFQVKDWVLSVNKRSSGSGFAYEYSVFPNKIMNFEAVPTYRSNGSVIENISSGSFTIQMKDRLNNIVTTGNTTWNSTCGNDGCYEFSLNSSNTTGQYKIFVSLSYEGDTQSVTKIIHVIYGIVSAQSTDSEGNLKELFGASDYVYFSLTSQNLTGSINLSDAEIFIVTFMNGTEINYTNVSYSSVNYSNTVYEWAWNASLQRIKLDVPKTGGVYNVFIFGNNRTLGTTSRFIINPYSVCSVPKDTPGTVSSTSGAYYVWQFKTSDTIYMELKITQANNPLGRATALNSSSSNGTFGSGSSCSIDTSTQQVVNNATITIAEVKNLETGALQNINSSDTTCKSDDNSGGYTCTLKPLTKWTGGTNIVKMTIEGQDGTTATVFSRFEARAFYLYGYSSTWQNSPSNNITLTVQLYEAGSGWWGSSSGLSGTVTVKKVEYMGRDGEWIWPPVDSGTNVSNLSTSITSGSGSITVPVANTPTGTWKTGNYRVTLEGKTNNGDTDYGYAWFGIKLWDVYGTPIDCTTTPCNYKNYFNSKENITLYIKISKAGSYNYNYGGNEGIWGNTSIGVKKIQDCRKWPCTEYNISNYNATIIYVNESSPWYWSANISEHEKFLIRINNTAGSWGSGYYNVVLDVNGTDTGYAWFNTIAFYVDTRPVSTDGSTYKYSIKPGELKHYNITVTKNFRGWGANYSVSDYVNVSFNDLVLRVWDQSTYQTKEYNYPEHLNVTPQIVNGSVLVNISYLNGSWPTGYYWGEIIYKNDLTNETSSGYIWFDVRPFRVSVSMSTAYEVDEAQCVNVTLKIIEPDWSSESYISGNYSISKIYEDIWSIGSRTTVNLTNYTLSASSFNATMNITLCPNNGSWGSGNYGGYHFIQFLLKDNNNTNNTGLGGTGFRAMPFRIRWGSVQGSSTKLLTEVIYVNANVTEFVSGIGTSGNLSAVYQWRYDNAYAGKESYVFSVGDCYSNVSGQCNITSVKNVTIYPNARGWKEGYNYLTTEWNKVSSSTTKVTDYSGINFNAKQPYSGFFTNSDRASNWKYNFFENESVTIKITTQDVNNDNVNVSITEVSYANTGGNCWNEWCRTYTTATEWSLTDTNASNDTGTSDGSAIILINKPSTNWTKGDYAVKVLVRGVNGNGTITGGTFRIIDSVKPNMTVSSPTVNQSVTGTTHSVSWTTTETANCYLIFKDYGTFYTESCSSNNTTNSTTISLTESCNTTKYGFSNDTLYYWEWVSKNYNSATSGSSYDSWSESGATGLNTDSTSHSYTFNASNKVTKGFLRTQHYAFYISCSDSDSNPVGAYISVRVNVNSSVNTSIPTITVNSPTVDKHFTTTSVSVNFTLDKAGYCEYSLNNGTTNYTMTNTDSTADLHFNATNSSITDGTYFLYPYCNDTYGNMNNTYKRNFTIDTINPNILYGNGTVNDSTNLSSNNIYVNVTINDSNMKNVTFRLFNGNGSLVNATVKTQFSNGLLEYRFVNWTGLTKNTVYLFNVTIYDKAGNKNSTSTIMTRVNTSETVNPLISYINASTASNGNQTSTTIDASVNVTEDNEQAIVYGLWFSNGSLVNRTQSISNLTTIRWSSLAEGTYLFNVTVNDTSGNVNFTSTNSVTIDTTNPSLSFGNGTAIDYANLTQDYIYVNVTITETNFKNVTYLLKYANGTPVNTTIYTTQVYTINWTSLNYSNYTYNVSVRDAAGNINSIWRFINLSAA